MVDGETTRIVGSVEASRGCAHRCRHCPVPVVYDGRVRVTDEAAVLADIEQLVAAGATHITFGDPDFLNAPRHSMRVVRAMHARFPQLTFDCTVKVEHVLRHADLWPELADAGCLFVVSAFESVNDAILERLDKGHTAADAAEAVTLLRSFGIDVRPSFLPFTPWTTVDDVIALLDFVHEHDLIGSVDPVQFSIRLLLPRGSLLLDHPDLAPYLGAWDDERLTYTWQAADPSVDALQQEIAAIVEAGADSGRARHRDLRAAARRCGCAARRRHADPARPPAPQRELVLLRGAHRGAGGAAQVLTNARYTSHPGSRRAIIWISWVLDRGRDRALELLQPLAVAGVEHELAHPTGRDHADQHRPVTRLLHHDPLDGVERGQLVFLRQAVGPGIEQRHREPDLDLVLRPARERRRVVVEARVEIALRVTAAVDVPGGQSPFSTLSAEPARNHATCSSDIVCVVEISSVEPSAWCSSTVTGRPGASSARPTMSTVSSTRTRS